jgi:hypothetical protein
MALLECRHVERFFVIPMQLSVIPTRSEGLTSRNYGAGVWSAVGVIGTSTVIPAAISGGDL